MLSILVDIGTPAQLPKHREKSPGGKKERHVLKHRTIPLLKNGFLKAKNLQNQLFNLLPLELLSNSLPSSERQLLLAATIV
jgi:hypothetical protein